MLPFLREGTANSKKYIVSFQGLNLSEGYAEGEFSDTKNLSSVLAPCVTQRFARETVGHYSAPESIHAKEGLVVIDGTKVLYKDEEVGTVTEGRKQIATIGNYIVVFPDKVYYNVADKKFGSMEESCTATGLVFAHDSITTTGEDFQFRDGDAVTISGCGIEANNKSVIIRKVEGKVLTFYENTFDTGSEEAGTTVTEEGEVSLKREVPDLEFICESNYRLWGVMGNTIYGSKYSDPLNFQVFDGLAGDSYYIDVGSEGKFTGCIAYSSHICFFKENTLHKLYGSKPSNYQMTTSQVYGVQAGSERSLCNVNETLFYKGVNGVYAYTGGVPELISAKFGTVRFSEACAASDGERYYISMKHRDNWGLYVYDVLRTCWMKEDELHCVDMAFHDGHVYFLGADGTLYKVDEQGDRSDMEWSLTLCPFNETMNERKGYSKFHARLEMAVGSWLTIEVKRDNDTQWQKVYTINNLRKRTISVPILPARCDSVEIRISGKGECLLRTFVREFFVGSDV